MKTKALLAVLSLLSVVRADRMVRTEAWATRQGAEAAVRELESRGIRDEANQQAILGSWDERVLVDKALEEDSLQVLVWAMHRDSLSRESIQRVLEHERAKPEPSYHLWRFVQALPRHQHGEFEDLMERLVPVVYRGRPVAAEMALKYEVRQGRYSITAGTETADLVLLLLAPEPMRMRHSRRLRNATRDHAVRLARIQLREAGKSFVERDGVNPLADAVRPVVEALNAPMALGLEEALRGLGADVEDRDRSELQAMTMRLRDEVLRGDRIGRQRARILGRLSIGLGVDAFNAFVEEHNHGTGGPGSEAR